MTLKPQPACAAPILAFALAIAPALNARAAESAPAAADGGHKQVHAPMQAQPAAHAQLRAKFGEGISVVSGDGDFGLTLKARAQVRATVGIPEDDKDPSADIQLRRMRVTLEGFARRYRLTYKVQLAMANLDLDPVAPYVVRDAYANFALGRDIELRAGQMKVPFGRQRVVSSGNLQMADRSIVTGEFNLDRDLGLQALSTDFLGQHGLLAYNVGVFGGDGRGRVSGGYGLLYAGRIELRALGGKRAAELDEPDFQRLRAPRLAIGLSAGYNHRTDRQKSTTGPVYATGTWLSYAHLGVDWALKWRGLSITGEGLWRRADDDQNTKTVDGKSVTDRGRSGYGAFFQVGKFLSSDLEVVGRLGGIYPLGAAKARAPKEHELGTGISYYFDKHALKLQADYFYLFEEWGNGRHQVRMQLQFAP